jgi:hypothetical protein
LFPVDQQIGVYQVFQMVHWDLSPPSQIGSAFQRALTVGLGLLPHQAPGVVQVNHGTPLAPYWGFWARGMPEKEIPPQEKVRLLRESLTGLAEAGKGEAIMPRTTARVDRASIVILE